MKRLFFNVGFVFVGTFIVMCAISSFLADGLVRQEVHGATVGVFVVLHMQDTVGQAVINFFLTGLVSLFQGSPLVCLFGGLIGWILASAALGLIEQATQSFSNSPPNN